MKNKNDMTRTVLGFVAGGVAFALLFVAWVYPSIPTASYALAGLLLVLLVALAWLNQKALKEAARARSVRYGANAAVTVGLVVAILSVVSYLNYSHFIRKDLTKNKTHSLSEQTIKILKDLKQDIKFTVFIKTAERDGVRPLLDNYRYQSKHLQVEYVDPDREPVRTKTANVKKYGTVVVSSGKRDTRVEEVTEDKLTNGILKVQKDTAVQACFITGHGERGMADTGPEGYSRVSQDLGSQNYESKTVNLIEEAKIPDTCTVVLIIGPNKSFFEKEVKALNDYLDKGGRALIALDPNLKGDAPLSKEMYDLLAPYHVGIPHNIVIDPASRVANVSASVPLIAIYNKDQPITKDFTLTTLFPLTSTVEIKPSAPSSLTTWWLARSTPYAFAKVDFVKELASGRVSKSDKDATGPNTVAVAIQGNREGVKSERPTRIVVLGSSQVGANRWAGFGGNADFVLNAVSWLAGDENLISIRPKDEAQQKATLSEVELSYAKFLTRLLLPGGTALAGLLVWRRRRKL